MSYKISGTTSENSRIIIIKQDTWTTEATVSGVVGAFEIDSLVSGTKTIIARDLLGKITGWGDVYSVFYSIGGSSGVFGGGSNSEKRNTIDYLTILSLGDATAFGSLSVSNSGLGGVSNGVNDRGVFAGGSDSVVGRVNRIEYITITSPSDVSAFGDLTSVVNSFGSLSNNTNDRGLFGGGTAPLATNNIDFITISTTGNAQVFGDLTVSRYGVTGSSNAVNNRGVLLGGYVPPYINVIDYITISSIGNAADFGDLPTLTYSAAATSNGTNERCVVGGGYSYTNTINYITISTTSNGTDFGELTVSRLSLASCSNNEDERGIFGGGSPSSGVYSSKIDYITISSLGNAADFGDLTVSRHGVHGFSNA